MKNQKDLNKKSRRKVNMKLKTAFLMLLVTIFSISSVMCVNAATISDDGQYTLVLTVNDPDGDIDGEYAKAIKFNVADGETTVSLSELTAGIVPFNGEYEFSHWGRDPFDDTKADDELAIADFTATGDFYVSDGSKIEYTNGLSLYAKFSDRALKGSGTYYLTLDPFAGKINGKSNMRLTSKSSEFQTVDLTKYVPVRENCTFIGWDLGGKFVTSVDASAFAEKDAVTVTATYTCNTFDDSNISVNLNANGGTIDGKASNKYNYLGGANSGTSMSLLPYIPVREGYTFTGWNTKSDGSGDNYKYLFWRMWDKDNDTAIEKDTLVDLGGGYQRYMNVTLYAAWTADSSAPSQPTEDTVQEIQSTGKTKANIEFTDGINKDYKLDIKEVEVKKELADKNVKFIADINVMDGDTVVKISDNKMKIRIALPEELKGYDRYEVVYILNDEIKETIPAMVEDGYIVFETSHLSQYGIIATNNGSATGTSPQTGDNSNIGLWITLLFVSGGAAIGITIISRKKKSSVK